MLLLNMPNTVVHRIDSWSPLLPPERRQHVGRRDAAHKSRCSCDPLSLRVRMTSLRLKSRASVLSTATNSDEDGARQRNTAAVPGLLLREVDEEVGSTFDLVAAVQVMHTRRGGSHPSFFSIKDREGGPVPKRSLLPSQAELETYMRRNHVEVLAVIEGIDAETSCTIQVGTHCAPPVRRRFFSALCHVPRFRFSAHPPASFFFFPGEALVHCQRH